MTDPTRMGKVAVLSGGRSGERLVSLESGRAVAEALTACGLEIVRLDPADHDFLSQLLAARIHRVFIAVHGRGGEDGSLQGLLDVLAIPYTGSGVLASALAFDKVRSKWLWIAHGLPVPNGTVVTRGSDPVLPPGLDFPLCVKPATEGSSLGVSRVESQHELIAALERAWAFSDEALLEEWVEGDEVTVTVLRDRCLPAVLIRPHRLFYDYVAKYEDPTTEYHCPAGLTTELEQALSRLALMAFRIVGARGWGRVDFRLTRDGRPRILEVNTVPGMTSHSLAPMAARAAGIGFSDLCLAILEETIVRDDHA